MADKKIEELRHEVHTLKGTGGNFGYAELFELAKRIEFEIVAENMTETGGLISSLVDIASRIEKGIALIDNNNDPEHSIQDINRIVK